MKTTKLILVTIIMFLASIGFSHTESNTANHDITPDKVIIRISIQQAAQIQALKIAIHDQISPRFLNAPISRYYSFNVRVHRRNYIVYGSYNEWKWFFHHYVIIKK